MLQIQEKTVVCQTHMTRTNGVMIWALSRQPTRRNCSTGEDASYPQLDGKTPWSFTVV